MEKDFEYPDYFARFYDILYAHIREGKDCAFYLDEIAKATGRILEIGVGTGRCFKTALNKGADIYGVDISKPMVDQLKSTLDKKYHHRIKQLDAVNMKLNQTFDLIIAPFRVFSHVLNEKDQIRFLNTVSSHLNPGGRFIFDLFVPNPIILAYGIQNQTDFEGEYEPGKRLTRTVNSVPDIVNQLFNITMIFAWDENNTLVKKSWGFKMRFFFKYEIEYLIRLSELNLVAFYGDFDKNPLTKDSREFIMVCERKNA
ncbi:MAG: class I SAM-dependent methyltransferase [Bacteroidales bacterium]|nr:class I SAM-dependent methyltransferase [Bacteroidales bacterium]